MAEVPPVGPNARGEGPPYAPPGFHWGVGCRSALKNGRLFWMDRYVWPPGVDPVLKKGVYLASKIKVEAWMKELDPAASMTELWAGYPWLIPAVPSAQNGQFSLDAALTTGKPLTILLLASTVQGIAACTLPAYVSGSGKYLKGVIVNALIL